MIGGRLSRRLGIAAVGVALSILAWLAWHYGIPVVAIVNLQPRELVHTVVATATVQTPHRANSGVQVAGKVRVVNVLEGEPFQQGQTLLSLDEQEAQAAFDAAQLSVQQAQLKWREWHEVQAPTAQANSQLANANLNQLQAQLKRQQALFEQGFIGQAALDESIRTFQVAQAQALAATLQTQSHEAQGMERALAISALNLAQANAQVAKAHLSYTKLKAPFDGLVVTRSVEPGDLVLPGKTLFLLAPRGPTELVAQIDERNLSLLREGQLASASADAYSQQHFGAVVSQIAPGIDAQRGSVQVKLKVSNPPFYLRQDMTVSVEIEVERQRMALALPLRALHAIESPQPWVWRVGEGERLQQVKVTLGLRSGEWVALRSGLQIGDRVVSDAGPYMFAGQRVRAQ